MKFRQSLVKIQHTSPRELQNTGRIFLKRSEIITKVRDEHLLTFRGRRGAMIGKSDGSRQELSNEYLVFNRKNRLRHSRERVYQPASRERVPKGSETVR